MPPPFLAAFKPDPDPLIKIINHHVDDAMLREIAAADYGQDIEQHLAPLRTLRDGGVPPEPRSWYPDEVLELIRWSQPDDPTWQPSGRGEDGYWMRAFACAALLQSGLSPEHLATRDDIPTNLPILLLSLDRLPPVFGETPIQFVAGLLEHLNDDEHSELRALCGIALIFCALKFSPATTSDQTLVAIGEWVSAREQEVGDSLRKHWPTSTQLPLLDETLRSENWQAIGRRLESCDLTGHSDEAQTWVRGVAAMLVHSED
jgi:hypothetical protein